MEASGSIWEAFGTPLGGIWRHLGNLEASWRHMEASGDILDAYGSIWTHLEGIWEASGRHLEHLGGNWEASGGIWGIWEASGKHLVALGWLARLAH